MKDYYKNDEKFILNYEIKKNKIIIKFSNGEKWIGTKDNIDLVKSIMKMQVKEFDKTGLIKDEKKVKKLNYILTLFTVVGVFATLTVSLSNLLIALIIGVISLAGMAAVSDNISKLLEIKGLEELNIGHSIISKAVFVGLDKAVQEMKALLN